VPLVWIRDRRRAREGATLMSVYGVGEQADSCFLGGFGGFALIGETAEVQESATRVDMSHPLLTGLVPGDASVFGRRPPPGRLILRVLTLGEWTKVRSSAIKAIPVDMIALESVVTSQPKYLSVKPDRVMSTVLCCTAAVCVSPSTQRPPPAVYPRRVNSVNDGVSEDHTASAMERDTYGILKAHREPPTLGVVPRGVASTAGVSCVNYTSSLRVGG
jgi:hypothetical protein